MVFVGLQNDFSKSVCLFHAKYGGVVFQNEVSDYTAAASGFIDERFTSYDESDPDRRTYLAAIRRFNKDLAAYTWGVSQCVANPFRSPVAHMLQHAENIIPTGR